MARRSRCASRRIRDFVTSLFLRASSRSNRNEGSPSLMLHRTILLIVITINVGLLCDPIIDIYIKKCTRRIYRNML